jgi:hypothetical protein
LRSSGKKDDEDEAVEDGLVYVRLGTVRLPWKKRSHSSEAGLREDEGAPPRAERDLERDEDLLVVEDRAARDSIRDTLDTQLPCLDGVLSSSSARGTLTCGPLSCACLKMGILMPPSVSGGLHPRGRMDLAPRDGLDLISGGRLSLGGGDSGVPGRVVLLAESCRRSWATSSSLSSLPRVPIHTPTPTSLGGLRPWRLLSAETLQPVPRCPLKQA